jgi:propionyl-CoA carboxylase alpha chain
VLRRARIHGLTTNRDLLVRVLGHPAFLAGDTDTAFLDRHGLDVLAAPLADDEAVRLSALAATVADAQRQRAAARVLTAVPSGWRNLPSEPQRKRYRGPQGDVEVAYRFTRDGFCAEGFGDIRLVESSATRVVLDDRGVSRPFAVAGVGPERYIDSSLGAVVLRRLPRFEDPAQHVAAGSLLAPMPGVVARVDVTVGDRVTRGQVLLWLEAMKMQHRIDAPADGIVAELAVTPGTQVEVGAVLAVVDADTEQAR